MMLFFCFLDRAILNIGPREFACGLTYTGLSRVKRLQDLAFNPMPFVDRIKNIQNHQQFLLKRKEDERLSKLENQTLEEIHQIEKPNYDVPWIFPQK